MTFSLLSLLCVSTGDRTPHFRLDTAVKSLNDAHSTKLAAAFCASGVETGRYWSGMSLLYPESMCGESDRCL